MSLQESKPLRLIALSLVLFFFMPQSIYCQQKSMERGPTDKGGFAYSSQDRRDPFESVYQIKRQKKESAPPEKVGYELEELRLVGVIKTGDVRFVMMEDIQGRGLLFKKGDFLNSNLWLLDIGEDKVILAQKLRGDVKKILMDIPRK